MTDVTKVCTKCDRRLPLDGFYRHPTGKYGRHPSCKGCHNRDHAKYTRVALTCEACGKNYTTKRRNGRACSLDCRWFISPQTIKSSEVPWAQCPTCDGWFVKRAASRFCQEDCRPSRYEKRTRTRVCDHCGDEFVQRMGRGRRYCDQWCKREAESAVLVIRGCIDCGTSFLEYEGHSRLRCDSCVPDWGPSGASWISRADRIAIYKRDGYVCQLCGDPTSETFTPGDMTSPSLDHIFPRSLGGSDDPSNLQTAHIMCNTIKGAKLMEELPEVA